MARLDAVHLRIANEILSRYPVPRSALIPLLHLAQEQDGYVTEEAMIHIAELVEVTPAEVLGTASFYEMLKREPVGNYMVNICHGISCHLLGADDLIHHAENTLGVRAGGTTDDGKITLEAVECIAACTEAPCLQVNYRYQNRVTHEGFDELVESLKSGKAKVPAHGSLAQVRQHIADGRQAGVSSPNDGQGEPAWMARNPTGDDGGGS